VITDQVVTLLTNGKSMTVDQITAHIPELVGQPYGADLLRLLMRLDRRFFQHEKNWLLRDGVSDLSKLILQSARSYFQTHPKGELLKHLLPALALQTGQSESIIEKIILQNYRHIGGMVLNQPKERS
jgi:hypothetical protein